MVDKKNPREVAADVMKAVKDEIAVYEQGLMKMRAAEVGALKKSLFGLPQQAESNKQIAAKVHKTPKNIFDILGKAEDYIDAKGDADPNTRYVHVGAYDHKAEPKKPYPAPGSGGKISADKNLTKDGMDPSKTPAAAPGIKPVAAPKPMALKPAGVPGMKAGAAPKPPEAPGAPGMHKQEKDPGKQPVGVFARLAANKAHKTASGIGTPATQNLAAAKVLTQRVVNKGPLGKEEDVSMNQMNLSEAKKSETVFDILKKNEELEKKAPPGFSEETMHKLKAKHGTESAFKIAWAAFEKKGKTKKSEDDMQCPYCQLFLGVCPC